MCFLIFWCNDCSCLFLPVPQAETKLSLHSVDSLQSLLWAASDDVATYFAPEPVVFDNVWEQIYIIWPLSKSGLSPLRIVNIVMAMEVVAAGVFDATSTGSC